MAQLSLLSNGLVLISAIYLLMLVSLVAQATPMVKRHDTVNGFEPCLLADDHSTPSGEIHIHNHADNHKIKE
ncbi:hypothetical protein BDA99DRAFT_563774 [Phascolomyces articulosus]|uniref:Transmembrane protein n=1 Tax=Phascolomyces articulosus TaxID=60185 RepID=A0AAD5PBJ8_9FUNG|nr:hypothetical protein BDA99DRAFT_563774 [Phascolomyces articulosus]